MAHNVALGKEGTGKKGKWQKTQLATRAEIATLQPFGVAGRGACRLSRTSDSARNEQAKGDMLQFYHAQANKLFIPMQELRALPALMERCVGDGRGGGVTEFALRFVSD